jgi:hypothetical protein
MLTGLDWSSWSTVTDGHAMFNDKEIVDISFPRAWDGFRDDLEFDNRVTGVSYRKLLETEFTPHGSILWSPYGFVGYSANVGSYNWTAQRGDAQADNMWGLSTAGGRTFQLPAMVDAEHNAFIDANGVRQVVPINNMDAYCSVFLVPFIERMSEHLGRRPLFYSNPDFILNYLGRLQYDAATPYSMLDKYPVIKDCPLVIASYSSGTQPSYWTRVSQYWPQWLCWQNAGDIKDWPGISDVDHLKCQGTRSQWKLWMNDARAPMPQDGAVEPPIDPLPAPVPVVTWYAQVRSSAVGLKLRTAPSTTAPILDYDFRPVPRFEIAGEPKVDGSITWASLGKAYFAVKQNTTVYADVFRQEV